MLALPFLGADPWKLASQRDLPGATPGDYCYSLGRRVDVVKGGKPAKARFLGIFRLIPPAACGSGLYTGAKEL